MRFPASCLAVSLAIVCSTAAFAQDAPPPLPSDAAPALALNAAPALPDDPSALQQASSSSQPPQAAAQHTPDMPPAPGLPPPQPKRILGLMPNYRAVSAGVLPPPPTQKEAFKIATQNAFDYSAFTFVGMTSLIAEAGNSHPEFGKGVPGYYSYYWRGFIDKADGDYWVDWLLPTVFHEDERYYAMGRGPILKRSVYAATRVFITPNYKGHNTFNASELLGRGIAQGISVAYYPSQSDTVSSISSKYAYSIMRDAATNVFREVWPDISYRLTRHKS